MKKSFDYLLFENYIDSWLTKELKLFLSLLSSDIYIRECYGATYLSLAQAEKWFIHWNQPDNNKVLSWKICKHYYDFDEEVSIFEWSFAYIYIRAKNHHLMVHHLFLLKMVRLLILKSSKLRINYTFPINDFSFNILI